MRPTTMVEVIRMQATIMPMTMRDMTTPDTVMQGTAMPAMITCTA